MMAFFDSSEYVEPKTQEINIVKVGFGDDGITSKYKEITTSVNFK